MEPISRRHPGRFRWRNLPHWDPPGVTFFVTARLSGTLPRDVLQEAGHNDHAHRFVVVERLLDQGGRGPTWLRQPAVARIVADSIHHGQRQGWYALEAWVIMPNHVHLLLTPRTRTLTQVMHVFKGWTAKQANRVLGREGERFWQAESYDRWMRDEAMKERARDYIHENPVKAGLCRTPWDWPWTSARAPQL